MNNDIRSFDKENMQGRQKIIINVTQEQFLNDPLKAFQDNIGTINQIRDVNNQEIEYLIKYRKGINEIIEKIRKDNSSINNICVCNFAHEFVQFKKGFTVGKPIKYVNNVEETTDDMKYFNRYLKKVDKKSKDLNKYENLYTYGLAHTFIKFSNKDVDTEKQSPFDYIVMDDTTTCCVYSSEVGNPKLFSMVESNITGEDNKNITLYTLYYDNKSMIIQSIGNEISTNREEKIEPNDDPITEYELNQDRMGVFEPVLSELKTLNIVRSNQLDDIEQFINAFMVFLNQDAKFILANIEQFRKKRVLALKTNNKETPADVKMLQTTLNHSDINQIFNDTAQQVFNQVGVPMATSNTGQGVSGEAQTYGGGWENAQAIATIETTYITQFERQDLEKMVTISKEIVNSKIKSLDDADIDIKYTINKSNNILTKMQSFKYWIDMGGTWERGLEITDLTDDSHIVATECEQHIKEKQEEQLAFDIKKTKEMQKVKPQEQQLPNQEKDKGKEKVQEKDIKGSKK